MLYTGREHSEGFIPYRFQRLLGLVAISSVFYVAWLKWTRLYYGHGYLFLAWNLFLALIPLAVSLAIRRRLLLGKKKIPTLLLGLLWVIFFPNAPYMVTDLIHVGRYGLYYHNYAFTREVCAWLGMLQIATGVLLGGVSGVLSMYLLHEQALPKWGRGKTWAAVAGVSLLSGAAICLGRFWRYNSWDLLTRPHKVAAAFLGELSVDIGILWGLFSAMTLGMYLLFYCSVEGGGRQRRFES